MKSNRCSSTWRSILLPFARYITNCLVGLSVRHSASTANYSHWGARPMRRVSRSFRCDCRCDCLVENSYNQIPSKYMYRPPTAKPTIISTSRWMPAIQLNTGRLVSKLSKMASTTPLDPQIGNTCSHSEQIKHGHFLILTVKSAVGATPEKSITYFIGRLEPIKMLWCLFLCRVIHSIANK